MQISHFLELNSRTGAVKMRWAVLIEPTVCYVEEHSEKRRRLEKWAGMGGWRESRDTGMSGREDFLKVVLSFEPALARISPH